MNFMLPALFANMINVVVSGIVLSIIPLIIAVVILISKRRTGVSFLPAPAVSME